MQNFAVFALFPNSTHRVSHAYKLHGPCTDPTMNNFWRYRAYVVVETRWRPGSTIRMFGPRSIRTHWPNGGRKLQFHQNTIHRNQRNFSRWFFTSRWRWSRHDVLVSVTLFYTLINDVKNIMILLFSMRSTNKRIQAFMLKNNISTVAQLQGYYFKNIFNMTKKFNSVPIVWEEVFDENIDLDPNVVVHVWKANYSSTISKVTSILNQN